MSTPSSTSLTQSSSGSTSYHSFSSQRSALLNTVTAAFRTKKRGVVVDASVQDRSHHNKTYNEGFMNVAHGNNIVQNMHIGIDAVEALVLHMTRSRNAEFDMIGKVQRGPCTPQTCEYILKQLKKWCRKRATHLLYWLNGMPGTGKTTIVYTMCQYLHKHGRLGASFFCSRSVSDCQDIHLILPTIAFQLAMRFPAFKKELGGILREDPDIHQRPFNKQLQQLIIEPFSKIEEDGFPPDLVVVLDALDECNEKQKQSSFLQALVLYASQLPFRLLLTSRPEDGIYHALGGKEPTPITEKFVLHEVERNLVKEDIIRFLQSELPPLPDPSIINTLADHSGSTFILAATVVRLVMDAVGSPTDRLKSILNTLTSKGTNALTKPLDMLYTDILSRITERALDPDNDPEVEGVKDILFTVICVREPLTKHGIGMLWGLSEDEVEGRLKMLRSVVFIPQDSKKPATVFHASFIDYITNKERSGKFYCDESNFHDKLTSKCFRTMNDQLRQNICELEGCPPNESISQEIVESHVDMGLAYACVNWVEHLELSGLIKQNTSSSEEGREFVLRHLFHWLECLSIVGSLSVSEGALELIEELVKGEETVKLVQEAREFVRLNYNIINYSANEIYFSALIWVPTTSFLRTHYAELWKGPKLPRALYGLAEKWTEASRAIKIHSGGVKSLAITRDGTRIVSGSDDTTVRIWNVISQKEDRVFSGHLGAIQSVAISPDGSLIFSASKDHTVRVWDIGKPEPMIVFRGHSELVQSVAVSEDGAFACSCDLRSNIMVWNPRTAELKCSMKGANTTSSRLRALFMTVTSDLVSASFNIIQIWNLDTGAVIRSFSGHDSAIEAIAVAPQDAFLITGSVDKTARIWNPSSGKKVHVLRGHEGTVQSVAFFHDGHRAVTGSSDKTVRIWNVKTGDSVALLSGHSQIVWSVAVFPAEEHCNWQIASGSWDGTMMLWTVPESSDKGQRKWTLFPKRVSPQKEEQMDPWKGQLMASSRNLTCLFLHKNVYLLDSSTLIPKSTISVGKILSAALSPQETRLATAASTITIWEISTTRKVLTMKGHEGGVISISFSHDEKQIVTGSDDGTARVWCALTGVELRILRHPEIVYSVAFSPDDALIATSSNGKINIRLWDSKTGDYLDKPTFKTDFWTAEYITFSANGHFLIASTMHSTWVWAVRDGELKHSLKGYKNWTCLPNGVSYTIFDSSWICKTTDPESSPTKVCWIPPKYQPLKGERIWKPVAFSSPSGDRILLSSVNSTVVLDLSAL